MSNHPVLTWIKQNLSPVIRDSIEAAKVKNPDLLYTEDWLAAIACRETGGIISEQLAYLATIPSGRQLNLISALTRGDYDQRRGETSKTYHGFGFWQIDIGSFPDFVRSGDWKDPRRCCDMAIKVLEGKRQYLAQHWPGATGELLEKAITGAYNNGEGNELKDLEEGADLDARTTGHDYIKAVWEYREWYMSL